MPFYDYRCQACDHTFEIMQKSSDPAPASCPACDQEKLVKCVSAPAIQTVGGGQGHVHGPGCRH